MLYDVLKRIFDIFFGIFFLILSLPFIFFALCAIFLYDGFPVFYVQEREGKGGTIFKMYKIRTMKKNAEKDLQVYIENTPGVKEAWEKRFKIKNDPRIIPFIGQFLRSSSIDELPQFWNVIKGDMSIVGPRPLPLYHLEVFDSTFRALRRTVKPGITGLWQITAREHDNNSAIEHLDKEYISKRSCWYDIKIFLKTPFHVLFRKRKDIF